MSENKELISMNGNLPADTAGVAVATREQSEIQSAIVIAKRFPRDETLAYNAIIKSFERLTLAQDAVYSFPRGGQTIEGPSVDSARVMASKWGNIRYGIRFISIDDDYVHIKGYAIDLETNTSIELDDKFKKLVYRKKGGWVEPDERDLRELVNRRGAILERNAILKLIPRDFTEAAVRTSKETIRKALKGELKTSLEEYVRLMVMSFDKIGVSGEMLIKHLGHDLKVITEDEVIELKAIYKSIKDGNSKREDYFEFPKQESEASAKAAEFVGKDKKDKEGKKEDANA